MDFERESGDYATSTPVPVAAEAVANDVKTPSNALQPPSPVIKEKIPASADNDTATHQTISKMAEYARAGAKDAAVKSWSDFGLKKFPALPGFKPDRGACWSDFFLLKHCLTFTNDEPRLFEQGDGDALDLLIAPAVLVRMEHPAEDCDGFAMLTCSLLMIQGVKCYFVTVACDPSDRDRWSHVFAMAELADGTKISIDASKGKFPGWMVPRKHIFKWQAWDMDGNPTSVGPPGQNTLHGYRRKGVGDDTVPELGLPGFFGTPDFIPPVSPGVNVSDLSWTPASVAASNPSLSAGDISKIIAAATSGALNIFKQTQSPGLVPGTNLVFDPGTNRFLPASGYGAGVSSIFGSASTNMPAWLLPVGLGLAALLILPSLMGGRR